MKMVMGAKLSSRFIIFAFTFLLLVGFLTISGASDPTTDGVENDESDDLEQLLALDEEEEQHEVVHERLSEADVLSKAQRIVLELNSDNAKRVIDNNEYVMVLGYAPWCPRSAEIMPHFAEAATSLKDLGSPLLMAKLDAERYPKVASQLEIKGFPTLLLFTNGSSQMYTGGFSAEDIVIWVRKKTGAPVIRISTVGEAEEVLKKYHIFVLGLFQKFEGTDYEEFVKAAISDNEIQFIETNSMEVAKAFYPNISTTYPFLGIVKHEPERYTTYDGTFGMDKILQFLDYNKFPLVTKLSEVNSARVYSSRLKHQVFIFAKADEFHNLLQPLEDVARKFKSKVMFVYTDITDENLAKPFLTLFGLEDSENTVVTAFNTNVSSKFLLESDPSSRNIEEFCLGLLHDTLLPYFKSQPIPDNQNASVLAIVGKTFDELVVDSPKNVLLEVYTPWCLNCDTTSKQIEKLAKHFKSLDNLIFARIDASANEHPRLQADDYPTILLYKAGAKDNPIKISTKYSSKEMAMFINKQLRGKEEATKDEL